MSTSPETVLAFVLHRRAVGETSMLVTFFTREKGLIRARARGGRKQSKQAVLAPFMPLWLYLDRHPSGYYVKDVQIQACWGELPHFAAVPGLYLNELLYRFLHPEEEDNALFVLYEKTIQRLMTVGSQHDMEAILRQFEWHLLALLGHLVSFTHEAYQEQPIQAELHYELYPSTGFVLSSSGFLGQEILAIAEGLWQDTTILKTAKRIMRCLILEALNGAPIHTRELYAGR